MRFFVLFSHLGFLFFLSVSSWGLQIFVKLGSRAHARFFGCYDKEIGVAFLVTWAKRNTLFLFLSSVHTPRKHLCRRLGDRSVILLLVLLRLLFGHG